MPFHIAWGAAAFAVGTLVCLLNYFISRGVMLKNPSNYALCTVIRQILSVGLLIACYVIGQKTELNTVALLVGAALGVTLPSFYFTHKLLELNKNIKENKDRKDGESDG